MKRRIKRFTIFLTVFVTCTYLQQCAVNPVTGKKEFMLLSRDQEVQMGKEYDPQIISAYGLYPSDELQDFITVKGEEMVDVSHRSELDYKFRILDSPVVNAFAVPGGYVYFTRGILAHLNSEAEFAGVLGHEIGHIAARHSAKQYSRSLVTQLGLGLGTMYSEDFAKYADLATVGASLLFLKYGRDDESQSDKLGVEYSTKVGYNAEAMAHFFTTLNRLRVDSESLPTFLSTHPDPADREEAVREYTRKWQAKEGGSDFEINRNQYLRMIDGLVYGDDPRQGYVQADVFYHPELVFKFSVPPNWTLQNTPSQVNMLSSKGDAMIVLSMSNQGSLDAAARDLVESNNWNVASTSNVRLGIHDAIRIEASQSSSNSELILLAYLFVFQERIYQFVGVSYPQVRSEMSDQVKKVVSSFTLITDPEKIKVEPKRIHIVQVSKSKSLKSALSDLSINQSSLTEHAVLNGMSLEENVASGALIKVIY